MAKVEDARKNMDKHSKHGTTQPTIYNIYQKKVSKEMVGYYFTNYY